ncbi:DUF952 domain-containing protein [uncultured Jatrophihabitans sp.]|uniref:DUF952 domain-containing protein n=1 Tax=uncultured Jatrophihabitans sp. TaxID=1610747 RepID=UPI0035CC3E0E
MRLFHLVPPAVWAAAVAAGEYRPSSLDSEGFVHFSFAGQVTGTANLRYRDEPELVVVEIDSAALDAEVRVEDTYGSGTEFPHVYGSVPTSTSVAVHPLRRVGNGDWVFEPPT